MNLTDSFDHDNLCPAEALLTTHKIAREFFQGELYHRDGTRFRSLTIMHPDRARIDLDEAATGRLFMIPDGSSVWARTVREHVEAPAGLNVMSNNALMNVNEITSVIAYRDAHGTSLRIDALHIRRLMLTAAAPERLATVAFGLMAISAYRLGFGHINLFAAGNAPIIQDDPDGLVGYMVWPKFGFDAQLDRAELNAAPSDSLRACKTVQDVVAIDSQWWTEHGRGREMQFDLAANSRSWRILLNYLYEVLPRQEIEP